MAGSKRTQTRFARHKHLLYIPSLGFLDYCAPTNVDVFVECGMCETFRLFSGCHDGSGYITVSFDSVALSVGRNEGVFRLCILRLASVDNGKGS